MTTAQNMRNATSGPDSPGEIPLMLTEGHLKLTMGNPEQVIEEIRARADEVGGVLEDILHKPHGLPLWGFDE